MDVCLIYDYGKLETWLRVIIIICQSIIGSVAQVMDIKYICKDYQFLYRTSAVIFNNNGTKVLLFNVEGRKFYMLPGGKVNQKEESIDAIKREIKEELGYEKIKFSFLAVSEEFVVDKGLYNQQINLIYQGKLNDEIEELKFKGLEGDWINFEWIDISDIDNYEIYPKGIKEAIKSPDKVYHYIENLIK